MLTAAMATVHVVTGWIASSLYSVKAASNERV